MIKPLTEPMPKHDDVCGTMEELTIEFKKEGFEERDMTGCKVFYHKKTHKFVIANPNCQCEMYSFD